MRVCRRVPQSVLNAVLAAIVAIAVAPVEASGSEALPSAGVLVTGAVEQPRIVDVPAGESLRISELIDRAGGLRADAYALGAILLRPVPSGAAGAGGTVGDVARRELELLQILMSGPAAAPYRDAIVQQLEADAAYLRLPVAADAARRRAQPALDVTVGAGDILYIPVLPSVVAVVGEVAEPGLYRYESAVGARHYLKAAGGARGFGATSRAILYLPQGEKRALQQSFWNYEPTSVPPGSVIVVPREPRSPAEYMRALADMLRGTGPAPDAEAHR